MSREWIMGLQKLYSALFPHIRFFSLFLQDEEGTRAPSPASTSPPHQTQKIGKLRTYTGYVPTNSQTHELKPWVHISISGTRKSNQKEI